jgi:hypothetical protein
MPNWSWSIAWTLSPKALSSVLCHPKRAGKISPTYLAAKRYVSNNVVHDYLADRNNFQTLSSLALVFALHVFKVSSMIQQQRIRDKLTNIESQRHFTSWMKLMQLLISEMYPLWPTTSRIEPKMPNSSSSPCGEFLMVQFSECRPATLTFAIEMICLSSVIASLEFTRPLMPREVRLLPFRFLDYMTLNAIPQVFRSITMPYSPRFLDFIPLHPLPKQLCRVPICRFFLMSRNLLSVSCSLCTV